MAAAVVIGSLKIRSHSLKTRLLVIDHSQYASCGETLWAPPRRRCKQSRASPAAKQPHLALSPPASFGTTSTGSSDSRPPA